MSLPTCPHCGQVVPIAQADVASDIFEHAERVLPPPYDTAERRTAFDDLLRADIVARRASGQFSDAFVRHVEQLIREKRAAAFKTGEIFRLGEGKR